MSRRIVVSALLVLLALSSACRAAGPSASQPATSGAQLRREARATPTPTPPAGPRPRIVCLGDSLTSGYGLDARDAYPAHLQQRLRDARLDYEVVNAGLSGDTSAGGLRRLDWSLEGDVRILVVALGANDGLRGQSIAEMKRNLDQIVRRAQARRITVLLAGMELPPNMGGAYATAFRQAFRDVARERNVAFLPFLLSGVAGDARLNQGDSIHPNATGTRLVAENVWQQLKPLLEASGDQRKAERD